MKRSSSLRLSRPKPIGRWVEGLGRFSTTAMSHLLSRLAGFVLGGPANRADDVLVTRAAADRSGDRGPDLLLGGVGVLVQEGARGHQHPRRAEAALEGVALVEALLDRVHLAVDLERL